MYARHKLINTLQSLLLLGGMGALLAAVGWLLGGELFMLWMVVMGVLLVGFSPRVPPALIMRLHGAHALSPWEAPRLHALSEELARRAALPAPPTLYYLPSAAINAFTVGPREEAAIGVTDGLLRHLTLRELTGVLAHEISHVRHNDTWVMGLADQVMRITGLLSLIGQLLVVANIPLLLLGEAHIPWLAVLLLVFAPTLSALLQLALSRAREFDADLGAVELTGDPHGLAAALHKLEHQTRGLAAMLRRSRGDPVPAILRTHPATGKRIERLLAMAPPPPTTWVETGDVPVRMSPRLRELPRLRRRPWLWP
ncbi:M48 family metalloprotease [Ectothiorhodospiraceae bacterium 2226]|nr:M48 family metalloprotease [Ectothiorhodospiraceae bacterium 2226]